MVHDTAFAARLASDAGRLLRRIQRDAPPDELGTRELKDRGDRESQRFLARELAEHRPDDAILSEEAEDGTARLRAERVWIVDPLDGTREFSEGRDDWAVHVALWERGALASGAVALPGLDAV
ncbi:inositol monophosphatase family protein, partial [Leucobacter soli]